MDRVHSGVKNAVIPTGADLNWRTAWPGQWTCDNAGYIWADNLKGGQTHMIDVRGWGYLTGRGHGALDLSYEDAKRLQDELGGLLCAAPETLLALEELLEVINQPDAPDTYALFAAVAKGQAAVIKATTASSVGMSEANETKTPDKIGEGR